MRKREKEYDRSKKRQTERMQRREEGEEERERDRERDTEKDTEMKSRNGTERYLEGAATLEKRKSVDRRIRESRTDSSTQMDT